MPIPWDPPLRQRLGAKLLLHGVMVFHDFDWESTIGHNRTTFRGGQRLAKRVLEKCPAGRIPALILTTQSGLDGLKELAGHYLVAVNVLKYVAEFTSGNGGPDGYFAGLLDDDIFGAPGKHVTQLSASEIRQAMLDPKASEALQGMSSADAKRILPLALEVMSHALQVQVESGTTEDDTDGVAKLGAFDLDVDLIAQTLQVLVAAARGREDVVKILQILDSLSGPQREYMRAHPDRSDSWPRKTCRTMR